jgi:hypothetical protein
MTLDLDAIRKRAEATRDGLRLNGGSLPVLSADVLALLDAVAEWKRIAQVQDEKAHHWLERMNPLEAKCDRLEAENAKLRAVAKAAGDVVRFGAPDWRDDVDRGDADMALAEALAAL